MRGRREERERRSGERGRARESEGERPECEGERGRAAECETGRVAAPSHEAVQEEDHGRVMAAGSITCVSG